MSVNERDDHSGHMTTGHEWNGIKELNTNVPRIVWACLISSIFIALVMWIIWPTWPVWSTFTPGVLKTDERAQLAQELQMVAVDRLELDKKIEAVSYDRLKDQPKLLKQVRADGHLLFRDNCAACHGVLGQGANGFPKLTDEAWLWGSDEETIMETLQVGINDKHPDTRSAEMLAFGRDDMLERQAIRDVVAYLASIGEKPSKVPATMGDTGNGAAVFEENCASCHGEDAKGNIDVGAPNLIDDTWIYGGTAKAVFESIWNGRKGHMPAWEGRLSIAQRKVLTLYVMDLSAAQKEQLR